MGAYLERQTAESVRGLRWGRLSTVGRSGCGAVAAYNVAVALGKNPDFRALLWSMEQKHLPSFGGLLGMNVLRLRRWLRRRRRAADPGRASADGSQDERRHAALAVGRAVRARRLPDLLF